MSILSSGIYQTFITSSAVNPLDYNVFIIGDGGYVAYVDLYDQVNEVSPAGYSSFNFMDIDFSNDGRVGWIVSDSSPSLIMKSEDYGRTWQSAYTISDSTDARFLKVSPHNNFVYVGSKNSATSQAELYRSSGGSFSLLYSPAISGPFEDMVFDVTISSYVGLLHNAYAFTSSTSGDAFTQTFNTGAVSFDSLFLYDSSHVITGIESPVVSNLYTIWNGSALSSPSLHGSFSPAKAIKAVWLTTPDHGFVSFADGYFARMSGTTEEVYTQIVSTTDDCEDIAFSNTSNGYITVGARLYKTINTGDTWSILLSGSSYLRAIKLNN